MEDALLGFLPRYIYSNMEKVLLFHGIFSPRHSIQFSCACLSGNDNGNENR